MTTCGKRCSWCTVPGDAPLAEIGDECGECGTKLVEITDEGPPYGIVHTTQRSRRASTSEGSASDGGM